MSAANEIEVVSLWGDAVLDVTRFAAGERILIDDGSTGTPLSLARFSEEGDCTLLFPESACVEWRRSDALRTSEEIASSSLLDEGDRVRISIGALSWNVRSVPSQARVTASPRGRDYRFAKIVTTSVMTAAAFVAAIFMTDTSAFALSDDVFRNAQQWHVFTKPPSSQIKKVLNLLPKTESTKQIERFASKTPVDKPGASTANKRDRDRLVVMHSGLLDFLGGSNGASSNIFNSTGTGTRLNEAIDHLRASSSDVADSSGMGGMSSRGPGPGGGLGGLGLDGIGTRGGPRGRGPGGGNPFGPPGGEGLHHQAAPPPPTPPTLIGGCDRSVIGRVISRHMNEVRYCYETQLNINQTLAGKVSVSFTIDPTGAVSQADVAQTTLNDNTVEQCILARVRRWKFPEPKGGVCVVNYPWVLHPAGSEE